MNRFFAIIIAILFVVFFLSTSIVDAVELDLRIAQESVGKRFASKFCEVKEAGFSLESASDFALNNTYLKFVVFPDDKKYIEDIWKFTIQLIKNDCGDYVTKKEENYLRDFFREEGAIASNRYLYLPSQ